MFRRHFRAEVLLSVGLTCLFLCAVALPARGLPSYTGYFVNDFAYVLSYSEDWSLEYLCEDIEDETTVEIFVVTTDDLEGYDLNEYSYRLFNQWGIGKEDVNNGLLITYYYEDINETHYAYDFRIEVGRGLEGAITDSEAGRIGRDNMTVWFQWGYIYEGLYEGILELYDEFKDDPSVISGGGGWDLQTWAYENPLLAGIPIGVALMVSWNWLQFSVLYRKQTLVPLVATVGLLGFAWWLDSSLQVLFYAGAIALGVTFTLRGSSRFRSGGGRTEGGGWSTYLTKKR
jgi:uncharacterized membrane protein YgcG